MSLARETPELTPDQQDTQEEIQYREEMEANERLSEEHQNLCAGCALCEPDL